MFQKVDGLRPGSATKLQYVRIAPHRKPFEDPLVQINLLKRSVLRDPLLQQLRLRLPG